MREHARRQADDTQPAVGDGRRIADEIEERAAADDQDHRLAVEAELVPTGMEATRDRGVVLRALATLQEEGLGDELERVGMAAYVLPDRRRQPRRRDRDVAVDDDEHAVAFLTMRGERDGKRTEWRSAGMYHMRGGQRYETNRQSPNGVFFRTAQDAEKAGYRPAAR